MNGNAIGFVLALIERAKFLAKRRLEGGRFAVDDLDIDGVFEVVLERGGAFRSDKRGANDHNVFDTLARFFDAGLVFICAQREDAGEVQAFHGWFPNV